MRELMGNKNDRIEEKFEEAMNHVFKVLSNYKIKITTSAVTGRTLHILKRDKGFGKLFGEIRYDIQTIGIDDRGITLLFPESVLPQLKALDMATSKFEYDGRLEVNLPRECYQDKNLLVKLFKLAYDSY
jgi:hypothetical protein